MGGINKKTIAGAVQLAHEGVLYVLLRFLLAGDAELQGVFNVPFTSRWLEEQILCQLQKSAPGDVVPFKIWL